MPWYDYQCEDCGRVFEVQHPMGAHERPKCRFCGSRHTVKIFSPAGVHFKGKGFYVTDSKGTNGASGTAPLDTAKPVEEASTNGDGAKDVKEKTPPKKSN